MRLDEKVKQQIKHININTQDLKPIIKLSKNKCLYSILTTYSL